MAYTLKQKKAYQVAYGVTHPLLLLSLVPLLATLVEGGDMQAVLLWNGLLVGIFVIPLYLVYKWKEAELPTIISATVLGLLYFAVAIVWGAPWSLIVCMIAGITCSIVSLIVHQFVQPVSLYVLMIAGATIALTYTSLMAGLIMMPLGFASTWVNVQLGNADLIDVVLGWGVAMISVLVPFAFLL